MLIKLLELVGTDKNFSPQRMEIINTASTVFNIVQYEYQLIESFVITEEPKIINFVDILVLDKEHGARKIVNKHVHGHIEGSLIFMRVQSVDMYFTKYLGEESNALNGFPMQPNSVYLFSHGSTIKTQAGDALVLQRSRRQFQRRNKNHQAFL